MYRPAVIRCRLHTGGKTIDELKERYKGQGLTYRDYESLQRAFDLFDGGTLLLCPVVDKGVKEYHVFSWPKADMKIMDAVYEAEQTHPLPRYKGDKQAFMLAWLQGVYDAGAAFSFFAEDVEELEIVSEERDEPEPEKKPPAGVPRWRQVRDKQRRRKKGAGKR